MYILTFLWVSTFLEWETYIYAFCPLDISSENYFYNNNYHISCSMWICAEKKRSRCTCTTHMLHNNELLSLKEWHLKIGLYRYIHEFNHFQMVYHVTIVKENCVLESMYKNPQGSVRLKGFKPTHSCVLSGTTWAWLMCLFTYGTIVGGPCHLPAMLANIFHGISLVIDEFITWSRKIIRESKAMLIEVGWDWVGWGRW